MGDVVEPEPDARAVFVAELRRRREAAGFSRAKLADEVGYSREYVARAERPGGLASADLVRAIDAVLEAGGQLTLLHGRAWTERERRRATPSTGPSAAPSAASSAAQPLVEAGHGHVVAEPGHAATEAGSHDRFLIGNPIDVSAIPDAGRGEAAGSLGAGSAARTAALLAATTDATANTTNSSGGADGVFGYIAPAATVTAVRAFLSSAARVFLVSSPAGTGKTSLTRYLAHECADDVDVQLLTVTIWDLATVDVAVEILRYASIPRGEDALLTLEQHSTRLTRPCLVVVDGIDNHTAFAAIGRQVDAILRQVVGPELRFLLTVRTPPAVETTAYPLLHTSLFTSGGDRGAEHSLAPWSIEQARQWWSGSARVAFDDLAPGVQQLVRTPLYMKIALAVSTAGAGTDHNAYALLDHCVRHVLDRGRGDLQFAELITLARHQSRIDLPGLAHPDGESAEEPAPPELSGRLPAALVHVDRDGHVGFTHDAVGEFFLGTHIADLLAGQGRTVVTVQAFNQLADRAATSGAVRSIFALVIQRLDEANPGLLEAITSAPTASTTSMLPLVIMLSREARYVTPELLRACARRAEHDTDPALSRALLADPRLHHALGASLQYWLLALLRRFGSAVWAEIVAFVDATFDNTDARALLAAADMDTSEATFFARHFYLFFAEIPGDELEIFLGHPDWRVRAALADALGDDTASLNTAGLAVMSRLVQDADYKVRAAVALVVGRASAAIAVSHLAVLLTDENWHVRGQALHGLDRLGVDCSGADRRGLPARCPDLVGAALSTMATDPSWSRAPAHIRRQRDRLRILHADADAAPGRGTAVKLDGSAELDQPATGSRAMLTILREIQTGYLTVPRATRDRLLETGRGSEHWLVRREATTCSQAATTADESPRRIRERIRRGRGQRRVQVALDMHDIDEAVRVARAAASGGADFVEVGDPLIKATGVGAIEQIKAVAGESLVVAEMMSADWGRDQVVLAAEAGADIVVLIGPATTASVRAAVKAGQRLAVPVLLDVPVKADHHWITEMERAGIDGLTVTTNIDIGIGSTAPLDVTRAVRNWTALPVAVSGGFSAVDTPVLASPDWDVLIVGRGVAEAVDPERAVRNFIEQVHLSGRRP